mmetsp:Transcript_25010/g.53638  ORF Transcript_25010/g.53638 Transcript_25010/m.53638 type:complete len:292 (+) Transcript_25010:21-896(+)
MNALSKTSSVWYSELCEDLWPGQCMSIEVDQVLETEKSEFQNIEVIQTKTYGKMLCLDGIIQLTERDEFSYQEMLAFVPLFSHPNPKRVCIIGGGDGAVLHRLCMHPGLEEIYLCELDIRVIELSKKHFPLFKSAFEDPRVTIITSDGAKFLAEKKNYFDVVITDSSDPIGPADSLFSEDYYTIVHSALTENGVSGSQGESMWLHQDLIVKLVQSAKRHFNFVEYGSISIPTYPCGQIGVLVCSKGESCKKPKANINELFSKDNQEQMKYYTPDIHSACFVLPKFIAQKLL